MSRYLKLLQGLTGIFVALGLGLFCCCQAYAAEQPYEQTGTASVPCETSMFSNKVDETTRAQALRLAKADALDRYSSGLSKSQYALYQRAEENIKADLDSYIAQPVILREGYRPKDKAYFVLVRVSINTNAVNAAIQKVSGAAGGQKIRLAVLFVARATQSIKQFDTRRTTVTLNDNERQDTKNVSVHGRSGTIRQSQHTQTQSVSGGSTVRQADQLTYQVSSPEDMNAAMAQVFRDNEIDMYDYRDVSAECGGENPELVYKAFSSTDRLTGKIRHSVFHAAKRCEMQIFATGTLDSSMVTMDGVTGNPQVTVSVRTQVYDISRMLPRLIASVGPVQFTGNGRDMQMAQRNALLNAAQNAAREISAQLRTQN